jgi:hypothetical protein
MGIRAVVLSTLPQCNFCDGVAHYDFRTSTGPWAYGCEEHWRQLRMTLGLGLGEAQLLLSTKEVRKMYNSLMRKEVGYEEAFDPPRTEEG